MNGISQTLTTDEMREFEQLLSDGHSLPELRLATALASNGFRTFRVETEDRDPSYVVSLYPKQSQVVSNDEAVKCECGAVVYNRQNETAIHLSVDQVDSSEFLPTARQAFHEGDSYKERDATFRYHFTDGTVEIAQKETAPVERLDEEITFTAIECLGGHFPRKWLLETEDGDGYYLRERSGSIRMMADSGNGDHVFKAYIGGEHPGTLLHDDEILDVIFSIEYFVLVDDYDTEVSDELKEEYYGKMSEVFDTVNHENYDELFADEDED